MAGVRDVTVGGLTMTTSGTYYYAVAGWHTWTATAASGYVFAGGSATATGTFFVSPDCVERKH